MQPVYRVMNEGAVHGSVSIRVHLHIVLQQGGLFVFLLPLSLSLLLLCFFLLYPFSSFPLPRLHLQESRARISILGENRNVPRSFSRADEIGSMLKTWSIRQDFPY